MNLMLSRLGAWIGNLNDRTSRHDSRAEAGRRWVVIDRLSSWLYRRGDIPEVRRRRRARRDR